MTKSAFGLILFSLSEKNYKISYNRIYESFTVFGSRKLFKKNQELVVPSSTKSVLLAWLAKIIQQIQTMTMIWFISILMVLRVGNY